jgi:hypothetical protein
MRTGPAWIPRWSSHTPFLTLTHTNTRCAERSTYIADERSELTRCKHRLRHLTYCCALSEPGISAIKFRHPKTYHYIISSIWMSGMALMRIQISYHYKVTKSPLSSKAFIKHCFYRRRFISVLLHSSPRQRHALRKAWLVNSIFRQMLHCAWATMFGIARELQWLFNESTYFEKNCVLGPDWTVFVINFSTNG